MLVQQQGLGLQTPTRLGQERSAEKLFILIFLEQRKRLFFIVNENKDDGGKMCLFDEFWGEGGMYVSVLTLSFLKQCREAV